MRIAVHVVTKYKIKERLRLGIGVGMMEYWASPLPMVLAFHMDTKF